MDRILELLSSVVGKNGKSREERQKRQKYKLIKCQTCPLLSLGHVPLRLIYNLLTDPNDLLNLTLTCYSLHDLVMTDPILKSTYLSKIINHKLYHNLSLIRLIIQEHHINPRLLQSFSELAQHDQHWRRIYYSSIEYILNKYNAATIISTIIPLEVELDFDKLLIDRILHWSKISRITNSNHLLYLVVKNCTNLDNAYRAASLIIKPTMYNYGCYSYFKAYYQIIKMTAQKNLSEAHDLFSKIYEIDYHLDKYAQRKIMIKYKDKTLIMLIKEELKNSSENLIVCLVNKITRPINLLKAKIIIYLTRNQETKLQDLINQSFLPNFFNGKEEEELFSIIRQLSKNNQKITWRLINQIENKKYKLLCRFSAIEACPRQDNVRNLYFWLVSYCRHCYMEDVRWWPSDLSTYKLFSRAAKVIAPFDLQLALKVVEVWKLHPLSWMENESEIKEVIVGTDIDIKQALLIANSITNVENKVAALVKIYIKINKHQAIYFTD